MKRNTMASGYQAINLVLALTACLASASNAGDKPAAERQLYGKEHPFELADLPAGILREQLAALPAEVQTKALAKLSEFTFHRRDASSLRADKTGGIHYVCRPPAAGQGHDEPGVRARDEDNPVAHAPVPIGSAPVFHSKPDSDCVVYLDFNGHVISDTAWNHAYGQGEYDAHVFDIDGDPTTFNDAEQSSIKLVWERVAEDYAPFDVDVTTEEPSVWNRHTGRILITRNEDRNGTPMPADFAGGVAYVGVFGISDYAFYSPALVYYNNYDNREDHVAEAASHEMGHNMGLSHDGTDSGEYYGGHGSGDISWGPIMGNPSRSVTQWSRGEYFRASLDQDDLAILSGRVPYRSDDHGGLASSATSLTIDSDGVTLSSTNTGNTGLIERNTDTDVFYFRSGAGAVSFNIDPYVNPEHTRGGNLDILAELYDARGEQVASNNPPDHTYANINVTVETGDYYLHVTGVGAGQPMHDPPTGYTSYGSLGQYFISGSIIVPPAGWTTLPFYEPFEERTLGDLAGQNGWEGANAVVQTNVVYAGSKAAGLSGASSQMVYRFRDGETFLWTDLYIQPVFAADDDASVTNVLAGSSFAFYVNTNGVVVAYDGTTPTQLVHAALTPGDWVRFTIHSDYANTNWDLSLNGDPVPVASGLQFYDPTAAAYTEFGVRGAGATNAYVDEVRVQETHPFLPSAMYAFASLAVAETQGTVTATVVLSEAYDEEIRVDHYLVGGTAQSGQDFTNYTGGTLIFAPGETNDTFTFDILNDTNSEPPETIIFGLTAYSNCAPYEPSTLTVTIEDDGSDWTLPFYEPFEGLALGDLPGQNGWRGEGSIVQGDVVFGGQKAGSVTSATGVASHPFGDGQTNVWSDLYIQPDFGGNNNSVSNPPAGSSFGFFVNADGYVVAFDGTTRTQLVHDALSEGNWTRFTVHSDYANAKWDLYLFGDMIAGGLGFYDPAAVAYSEFGVRGAGSSDTHLDEVRIQDSSPPLTSVSFEPSEDANDETTNTVTVTVVLNAASGDEVRADHYLSGGTADIGDDFTYTPGTLIFDPGETTQTFSFSVINDFVPELDETVVFGLSNLVNAAIGWNPNFTYTILPEDTINWYVLPFSETFENRLEADLDGQYGWSSGSATVQTAVVYSGTKSAIIAEGGNIAHTFVGAHTNVWSDIYVRPLRGVPSAVPANSTFAFYVNTNGHVIAYDGDTATDLTPPAPTMAEGKWARFTVHSDYVDKTWDLYVNGMRRGKALAFYSTNTTGYSEFGVKINGGTNDVRSSYVDNIEIGFNRPFGVHDFGTLLIIR